MGVETWFHNLWRTASHNHEHGPRKAEIGVLAFEVATLMSKLVQLWKSLGDEQVKRLREEMTSSVGIKKLVSEDEDYIVRLICAELTYNLGNVAKDVARLGKKCPSPSLNSLELVFEDLVKVGVDQYGLEFTWKKMEGQVKRMERLISSSASLYQEMETLSELEQTFRRMKCCSSSSASSDHHKNLLEFQRKIGWKRQEVRNLQECSLWGKSYDYCVTLMLRSIFTVFHRIKFVFDIEDVSGAGKDHGNQHSGHSLAALMHSSVHPSENTLPRFSSGPLGKSSSKSIPGWKSSKVYKSFSGPLGSPRPRASQSRGGNKSMTLNFHSGPLAKLSTKSDGASKRSMFGLKLWPSRHNNTLTQKGKYSRSNSKSTPDDTPMVCSLNGTCTPVIGNEFSNPKDSGPETSCGTRRYSKSKQPAPDNSVIHQSTNFLNFSSNGKLLEPPSNTLGASALALQYANIIIVIEKLAVSPHLIGQDAREDLYSMLPSKVRSALREKLRPYSKALAASSVYDTVLADEWSKAIFRILEWLSPLAHNMIRWQSERGYEQQNLGAISGNNVLLVQTLYYADQEKAEAVVTELLVGLNYVWRFGREIEAKVFMECASSIKFGNYLHQEGA